MYLTAALTGLRQGELLAVRWEDIDWEARRVDCAFDVSR
jgi:integrase